MLYASQLFQGEFVRCYALESGPNGPTSRSFKLSRVEWGGYKAGRILLRACGRYIMELEEKLKVDQ
jgi:hypothetical protein